jgi:hypothetical protein
MLPFVERFTEPFGGQSIKAEPKVCDVIRERGETTFAHLAKTPAQKLFILEKM